MSFLFVTDSLISAPKAQGYQLFFCNLCLEFLTWGKNFQILVYKYCCSVFRQKRKRKKTLKQKRFFSYFCNFLSSAYDEYFLCLSRLLWYLPQKYIIIHKPLIRTWKDHFISCTTSYPYFPGLLLNFLFNANNPKMFHFSYCKAITFSLKASNCDFPWILYWNLFQ